jgi:hypothetical protein
MPSNSVATAIRVTFAALPPTIRAERAAQIEEQLQKSVVSMAGKNILRAGRSESDAPAEARTSA